MLVSFFPTLGSGDRLPFQELRDSNSSRHIVKSSTPNGMVLVFVGVFLALVGFVALASLSEGNGPCWEPVFTLSSCRNIPQVSVTAFYLALAGSALSTVGVWESGIGRSRIVMEGAAFVLVIGSVLITLGFYIVSLPNVSFLEGQICYFCGLLGGSML